MPPSKAALGFGARQAAEPQVQKPAPSQPQRAPESPRGSPPSYQLQSGWGLRMVMSDGLGGLYIVLRTHHRCSYACGTWLRVCAGDSGSWVVLRWWMGYAIGGRQSAHTPNSPHACGEVQCRAVCCCQASPGTRVWAEKSSEQSEDSYNGQAGVVRA